MKPWTDAHGIVIILDVLQEGEPIYHFFLFSFAFSLFIYFSFLFCVKDGTVPLVMNISTEFLGIITFSF